MQHTTLVDSLMGTNHSLQHIDQKTTKISNDYIDMYLQKKNVLFVVDKRDVERKKVYNNLKTAMHYLQKQSVEDDDN